MEIRVAEAPWADYKNLFSPNQAKIVANSAKAFAALVSEAGIATD